MNEGIQRSWLNKEKRRYYRAWLMRDLLGDWVLVRAWGSTESRLGGVKQELMPDYALGKERLRRLDLRRRRRGYEPAGGSFSE